MSLSFLNVIENKLEHLLPYAEVKISDPRSEIYNELLLLYNYEISREPKHQAFLCNYRFSTFYPDFFLKYYLDPWGDKDVSVRLMHEDGFRVFYIKKGEL